jgi:8-oxo-dGTP diphosphatase
MPEGHDSDIFRFCPACGHSLVRCQIKAGEPERSVCERCGYVHYLDPKVAVGAIIVVAGGHIALVRRAIEPGYGKWVFPGGYVDRGERLEAAAVREAREEAGVEICIDRLLNVYSYTGRTPIIVVYVASVLKGELCAADECLEARAFAPDEIPWADLAFVSTRDALEEYLAQDPLTGLRRNPTEE